ncbi:hypothetical protein DBV15_01335 [Temnothorax longispinosus]|uniref:Uncharacterized protein n=1 Tax=Temnothorax longispinosus TaxID=300112 RepID=A0A4S2KJY3_9HYME|nr:hypothetical protein DBV15_01335 [Temnothorax longispinosus]
MSRPRRRAQPSRAEPACLPASASQPARASPGEIRRRVFAESRPRPIAAMRDVTAGQSARAAVTTRAKYSRYISRPVATANYPQSRAGGRRRRISGLSNGADFKCVRSARSANTPGRRTPGRLEGRNPIDAPFKIETEEGGALASNSKHVFAIINMSSVRNKHGSYGYSRAASEIGGQIAELFRDFWPGVDFGRVRRRARREVRNVRRGVTLRTRDDRSGCTQQFQIGREISRSRSIYRGYYVTGPKGEISGNSNRGAAADTPKLDVRPIASAIWIDLRGFYSHGLAIAQGRDATK